MRAGLLVRAGPVTHSSPRTTAFYTQQLPSLLTGHLKLKMFTFLHPRHYFQVGLCGGLGQGRDGCLLPGGKISRAAGLSKQTGQGGAARAEEST